MKKSTIKFIESEQRSKCLISSIASVIAVGSIVGLIFMCNDASVKPSHIVFGTLLVAAICVGAISMIMCNMDIKRDGFKEGINE